MAQRVRRCATSAASAVPARASLETLSPAIDPAVRCESVPRPASAGARVGAVPPRAAARPGDGLARRSLLAVPPLDGPEGGGSGGSFKPSEPSSDCDDSCMWGLDGEESGAGCLYEEACSSPLQEPSSGSVASGEGAAAAIGTASFACMLSALTCHDAARGTRNTQKAACLCTTSGQHHARTRPHSWPPQAELTTATLLSPPCAAAAPPSPPHAAWTVTPRKARPAPAADCARCPAAPTRCSRPAAPPLPAARHLAGRSGPRRAGLMASAARAARPATPQTLCW